MTAKPEPARLRRERRRQQGQNRVLKILKGIVPVLILLGTLILIPNPGTLVGLEDLAAAILAGFVYWRLWKSEKAQSGTGTETAQPQSLPPPARKGDSWFVNLIALVWGSHKIYQAMTPGWRKLIKGFFLAFGVALLLTLIVSGIWLYGRFNPAPTSLAPTPIPSPFWPSGQTQSQGGEVPLEGFNINATPTSGIPLEGFEATSAAPAPDEVFTLAYPGGVGLYDWIWQQLGYSLSDASDPNGSFVCVYKAEVRTTGIEAAWKKDTSSPITIPISKQTIEVCGGVK